MANTFGLRWWCPLLRQFCLLSRPIYVPTPYNPRPLTLPFCTLHCHCDFARNPFKGKRNTERKGVRGKGGGDVFNRQDCALLPCHFSGVLAIMSVMRAATSGHQQFQPTPQRPATHTHHPPHTHTHTHPHTHPHTYTHTSPPPTPPPYPHTHTHHHHQHDQ